MTNFIFFISVEEDLDGIDTNIEDETSSDKKEEINVGSEHVKKVEAFYCDLCRCYLPPKEEETLAIKRHCACRSHLKAYVRYRDDKSLRKAAELIHKRHQEALEAKVKQEKVTDDPKEQQQKDDEEEEGGDGEKDTTNDDPDEGSEDKMWADVDKDLGELLREVGPEVNNDDEDDEEDSRMNAER